MKKTSKRSISAEVTGEQIQARIDALWPAIKGSLAKVYKPCIRKNCPACARGDKHPAWILTLTLAGRRKCLYVPETLVPHLKQAISNGREIEDHLSQMGLVMMQAFRLQRDKSINPRKKAVKS